MGGGASLYALPARSLGARRYCRVRLGGLPQDTNSVDMARPRSTQPLRIHWLTLMDEERTRSARHHYMSPHKASRSKPGSARARSREGRPRWTVALTIRLASP